MNINAERPISDKLETFKKNKNVFVQLTPLQKLACNISVQNVSKDKTLQVMGEMGGFPNSVGPMLV